MDQNEIISILCSTDNNYAPYCGIMLTSLFESNRDCHFEVYVLTDGSLSEENLKRYGRLDSKYGNEIILRTIDDSMFKGVPINEKLHITIPTYYRLMASSVLPDEVRKCIYLDADLIVCGDIKPLWNLDLSGKAIAGVNDCNSEKHHRRLGYPFEYGYINAGVCVFNLDYWRENQIQERAFDYIFQNIDRLPLMDQDTINGLLYDRMIMLPERYNFQTLYFFRVSWNRYTESYQKVLFDECRFAVIKHYCYKIKPWNYKGYGGPFFSDWEKYRRKSLWRDCRDIKPYFKYFKYVIKRHFFQKKFRSQHPKWIVTPENKNFFIKG